MNLSVYAPPSDKWVQYFKNSVKSKPGFSYFSVRRATPRYFSTTNQTGGEKATVQIVSPSTQSVAQAKSDIKTDRKKAQTGRGSIKAATPRKRTTLKRKSGKVQKEPKKRKSVHKLKDILSL